MREIRVGWVGTTLGTALVSLSLEQMEFLLRMSLFWCPPILDLDNLENDGVDQPGFDPLEKLLNGNLLSQSPKVTGCGEYYPSSDLSLGNSMEGAICLSP